MEINEGRWKVQHTSVYVRLPLVDRPNEYLLVWTTTPWTLPANVACAVNPDLTYAQGRAGRRDLLPLAATWFPS